MSVRLQPNHPTDDVKGIAASMLDGLLYGCGSFGSLALAPLVGLSAGARTIEAALRIPLFMALILAAATFVFVLIQ